MRPPPLAPRGAPRPPSPPPAPPPDAPPAPVPAGAAGDAGAAARPCLNCGTPVALAYCPACGQDYEGAAQITVGGAFGDFVAEFVRVEVASREFLRSLRVLVTRPGLLSAEYLAGRRAPYYSPGALFLLLNGAFFFAAQWAHPGDRLGFVDRPGLSFAAAAEARGLSPDAFAGPFAAALADVEAAVFVVTVPVLTLTLLLVYRRQRPFAAHAIVAIHVLSFFLLTNTLNAPFAAFDSGWTDVASGLLLIVLPALYTVLAVRRVYGGTWLECAGKGAVAVLGLAIGGAVWDYVSIWLALLSA